MLNTLKMQLYWMLRSLKPWILMIICVAFSAVMTYMLYVETDMLRDEQYKEQFESAMAETEDMDLNVGVQVDISQTEEFKNETAYKYESLVSTIFASGFVALMTVIFAVTVAMAEFKNGYVKNIVCAMKKRWYLPVSKAIAVAIYVIIMVIASTLGIIITSMIISAVSDGGFAEFGSTAALFKILGMQSVLHIAISVFFMAVMIITRSTVISIIFGVCSATNVTYSVITAVDSLITKFFSKGVSLENYIVSTHIFGCSADIDSDFVIKAVIISVCFVAAAIAGSVQATNRRDIK